MQGYAFNMHISVPKLSVKNNRCKGDVALSGKRRIAKSYMYPGQLITTWGIPSQFQHVMQSIGLLLYNPS